jgi:hypothetical protein
MKDRIPIIRNVLRNDLLDRIKEKHDQWFADSMELYKMGGLKPGQAVNDVITVMTYQVVWLLDYYDVDLNEFIDGLRSTMHIYRKANEQ